MFRHPEQSDKLLPAWRSCPGTAFIVQKEELVNQLRTANCPKALIMGLPALYKIENYENDSFRSIRDHICMQNPKGIELIEYSVICRSSYGGGQNTPSYSSPYDMHNPRTREELANRSVGYFSTLQYNSRIRGFFIKMKINQKYLFLVQK